jgi:hypothetical protein
VYNGKEAVTKWQVVPSARKGDLKDVTGIGGFSAPTGSKGKSS